MYSAPDAKPCGFEKFPPNDLDVFYLRPKASYTSSDVWYDCVPVGIQKLKKYLECMCKEAGITEKKNNHSLRATGASALFNAGVPEKLIIGSSIECTPVI